MVAELRPLKAVGRNSKAPRDGCASRAAPRWSVSGAPLPVPASMAGLPGNRAIVWVGPPLFCRAPSDGSLVTVGVPLIVPVEDITRLAPLRVTVAVLVFLPLTALLTRSTPPVELDRMLPVILAVADWAVPLVIVLP